MTRRGITLAALIVTLAVFFAAARLLPAVETGAVSVAAEAGYTNQLIPLIAILLAGMAAVGAAQHSGQARSSPTTPAEPPPGADGGRSWRWHVLAAAALSVLVVCAAPVWSSADGYFGRRVLLMDAGQRPYVDFEYAYGYLVAYPPWLLHQAGLTVSASLAVTLSLAVVAGVGAFAALTRRWIATPALRLTLFWTLVACGVFVAPGPSLNYNFGRYALPFALLGWLARRTPGLRPTGAFAAAFVASGVVYCISPEMGCAFSAAGLAWLSVAAASAPRANVMASLAGLGLSLAALLVFAGPMFTTLVAYGQSQVLMPVVPNLIMTLAVGCALAVGGLAAAEALATWRGKARAPQVEFCAMAALAAALLPALVGRSWPTITIAYGFAPILLAIGRLTDQRAVRAAWLLAAVFVGFAGFVAWPGFRADLSRVHALASGLPLSSPRASDAELRALLSSRFPHAYDPLAAAAPASPPLADVGYYPGLGSGDADTAAAVARKGAELQRAAYYLIPAERDEAIAREGAPPARSLRHFAELGLYPMALDPVAPQTPVGAAFVATLYDRCLPLAQADGVEVCRLGPPAH